MLSERQPLPQQMLMSGLAPAAARPLASPPSFPVCLHVAHGGCPAPCDFLLAPPTKDCGNTGSEAAKRPALPESTSAVLSASGSPPQIAAAAESGSGSEARSQSLLPSAAASASAQVSVLPSGQQVETDAQKTMMRWG